jgi:hypothetical protein
MYLLHFIPIYDVYKNGRRNKYKLEQYIDGILKVLQFGFSWNNLDFPIKGDTLRKKFYKWVKLGIFKKIFNDLLENYLKDNNLEFTFIDSTDIANFNGYLDFGFGYKIKNKKSIRLTCLIDSNFCPLFYRFDKSSKHDSKIMEDIVNKNQLNLNSSYHKPIYIGVDKGYQSNDIKKNLKKQNIIYTTPVKKNCKKKIKLTTKFINCLKKRYKVEHYFSLIKKYFLRITRIMDRSNESYDNFLCMMSSIMIIRSAYMY